MRRRRRSASASKPMATRSPRCSRPRTRTWRQDLAGARAVRADRRRRHARIRPSGEAGRVSGVFKLLGQTSEKRGAAQAGRHGRARQARSCLRPARHCRPASSAHSALVSVKPLPPVLAIAIVGQGPQGRRQARAGAAQTDRGGPVTRRRAQSRKPMKWSCGGRAKCTCASHGKAGRRVSALPSTSGRRRSAIARRSASRCHSAAATRSSPAVMASSATWCSTSNRCRAERASSSRTKITGGVVPRNYIPSVEEGVLDAPQARPAWLPGRRRCGDADRWLVPLRRLLRHGVPYRRRGSASSRRCRNASRCCWSRSIWSRSSVRPTLPRRSTRSCRGGAARSSASTRATAGPGWDIVRAMIPEAEIGDLIVEVRSATAGVGTFTVKFDHMAELIRQDRGPDRRPQRRAAA